jgi:Putative Flp pilus-assembly TadE/G-like
MSKTNQPIAGTATSQRRVPRRQRGQALAIMGFGFATFFVITGYVVDLGRVYISYRQLKSATDAAALAGGEAMAQNASTQTSTTTVVDAYSSSTGGNNTSGNLSSVTTSDTFLCWTELNIPCYGAGAYNAIQVTQTANVNLTFASFFHTGPVALSATSTAAMAGAATTPYNVAIIVDSTQSMNDTDSDSQCKSTRLACALSGVQTLLGELFPCASYQTTCTMGTGANAAVAVDPVDSASLFTFPNLTVATVGNDITCPTSDPTINPYTFPSPSATSLSTVPYKSGSTTVQMTYQLTPFQNNYRSGDGASSLTTSAGSVIAAGASGSSSCKGLAAPGGEGTYYAGVIYAAQAALVKQQTLVPGSQNVIILISDGDATASQSQMSTTATTPASTLATNGGTYPSWVNECHQAITAAQAAATAGTRVYTIAYGATSTGCATDKTTITPCQTLKDMASSAAYFYSDYSSSGSGVDTSCAGSGASTTNINEIFTDIFTSFTVARLIGNTEPKFTL